MYIHEMGKRACDSQGCGHYGASRAGGSRKHVGIDLCESDNTSLKVGTEVQLGFTGEVVKVGWAYRDPTKAHLRYIAIKVQDFYVRVFYVEPKIKVGDKIGKDDVIGTSLCLGEFYNGITEHVHFEVYHLKNKSKSEHSKSNFKYVDPNAVLEILRSSL